MEISNIWTALSTENPELVDLITQICMFIESFLYLYIFLYIFNINSTKKQNILYILIIGINGIISSKLILPPYNFILNYIIMFLTILIIFKLNPIKVILCMIIPIIVFALVSSLISNPYLTLLNITYEESQTIPIYKLGFLILIYAIISLLIILIKSKNLKLTVLEELDKKTKILF